MERLKIHYNGDEISINPFNTNNEDILELNDYLQDFIDSYSVPFELNIDIDEEKIVVSSPNFPTIYNAKVVEPLSDKLISVVATALTEEELLLPVESHICYDKEAAEDEVNDFND